MYILFIPLLILIIGYVFFIQSPKQLINYIKHTVKMLPILIAYSGLLYLLEINNAFGTDWAFYTFIFFFIPFSIVIIILRFYFWFREKEGVH